MPVGNRLLDKLEFPPGKKWTIKWNRQVDDIPLTRKRLWPEELSSKAGNDDSSHHQRESQNFECRYRFAENNGAEDQDEHESQTHKRVRIAQFKLGHCGHPGSGGEDGKYKDAKNPGIEQQGRQKTYLRHQMRRKR